MKIKALTLIIGFTVLIAVLISCVTIPLKNENSDITSNIESLESNIEESINTSTNSDIETSSDTSQDTETSNTSSSTESNNSDIIIEQSMNWNRYSAQECDEYFKDSVFVGDSVMLGYKSYVERKKITNADFLSKLKFHVAGSYGAESSLWPISDKSVHPLYQGEQMKIEDAMVAMQAKRVYILFGLNDVGKYSNGTGPEETLKNYKTLFSRIKEKSPDIDIVIISATYLYEDWEEGLTNLTSNNLRKLNQLMLEYCNDNGMDYIDVATALATDDGYLKPEYCSDKECHLYDPAYDIWTNIFRAYAASKLDGNYKNVASMVAQFE